MRQIIDYTKKVSDFSKIFAFDQKGIDTRPKPDFIPFISPDFFSRSGNKIVFIKNDENEYIIFPDNAFETLYKVNLDILALTQDFYLKVAKEKQRRENEEKKSYLVEKYGEERGKRLFKGKRVSVTNNNRMSYFQMTQLKIQFGERSDAWKHYRENIEELNQKLEDFELERLDDENTHSKGELTSYGNSNLSSVLFDSHGVKIKRQNGEAITLTEAEKIQNSLDDIFKVFGDLSPVFRQYGLKISFAGDKRMHARKAIGLFYNAYKAIGTSETGMTQTLSHEIAHFMDSYTSQNAEIKRAHASDQEGSNGRKLAKIFRRNMNRKTESKYFNRTCECFARAFEQYFNPKLATADYYCKHEVFESEVKPLVKSFLDDFNKIVESVRAEQKKTEKPVQRPVEEKAAASMPLKKSFTKPEQLNLF